MKQTTLIKGNNMLPLSAQDKTTLNPSDNTRVEDDRCPVCGYRNIPGLVICWVCGHCLDKRLLELQAARVSTLEDEDHD